MAQINTRRKQALVDIKAALVAMTTTVFQEVSYTLKSPEEVQVFPAAYIVGGGGDRIPADIQNVHFDHSTEIVIYTYWKEATYGNLALELEDMIEDVLNKLDAVGQTKKTSEGYDFYVSHVETDEGTLSSVGLPISMAIITVTALLPASD